RARVEAAAAHRSFHPAALLAPRDDVDHAADRVRAEQGGARSLDDLDALDELGRDVLDGRATDGAGVDAHAVDQHERVIALGAAHEHGRRLARTALAPDVQP